MKLALKFVFASLLATSSLWAQSVVTASSCSAANIQSAVTTAGAGGVVLVPGGTCDFTSGQTVTLGGSVTIVPENGSTVNLRADVGANGSVFTVSGTAATDAVRVGYFNFLGGTQTITVEQNPGVIFDSSGSCDSAGNCTFVRLDHADVTGFCSGNSQVSGCNNPTSSNFGERFVRTLDDYGLLDNDTLVFPGNAAGQFINPSLGSMSNNGGYGDQSFATADNFGSRQAMFIEDGNFSDTKNPEGQTWGLTDTSNSNTTGGGSRFVVRHSTLSGYSVYAHGTETGGRARLARSMIVYNDTFNSTAFGSYFVTLRGGVGIFGNNTINCNYGSGATCSGIYTISNFRTFNHDGGWGIGGAGGPWDANDEPTSLPSGCSTLSTGAVSCYSGTISAKSSSSGEDGITQYTITPSGSPAWTTNQWAPASGVLYAFVDTSQLCSSTILSSTTTTFLTSGDPGCPSGLAVNDTFVIIAVRAYYIGTIGSVATGTTGTCGATTTWNCTMTDSGAVFPTDGSLETAGNPYTIVDVTNFGGAEILNNTATSISISHNTQPNSAAAGSTAWNFNVGDVYVIARASVILDQTGRGQSSSVSGAAPSPIGWVNNALSPLYEFGDTINGTYGQIIGSDSNHILSGRDYYTQASGTTSGALVNRPATGSATGVGYLAVDAGAGAGTLYTWSGSAWTPYFVPYQYPHPAQKCGVDTPFGAQLVTSPCWVGIESAAGTRGVLIVNNTAASINMGQISITGDTTHLSQTNTCGSTLASDARCSATITDSAGNSSGTLSIETSLGRAYVPINNGTDPLPPPAPINILRAAIH